jgi:hypothetical protein
MEQAIVLAATILGLSLLVSTWALTSALQDFQDALGKRRHTYPTADGLEDATAIAIETLLEEQAQAAYRAARIEQLRQVLGKVREGPLAYDGERPNGRNKARQDKGKA